MTKIAVTGLGFVGTASAAYLPDASLMCGGASSATEGALQGADVTIVTSADFAIRDSMPRISLHYLPDLSGRPDRAVESFLAHEGIGW